MDLSHCLTPGKSLQHRTPHPHHRAEKVQALHVHSFIQQLQVLMFRDHTKEGLSWDTRNYRSLVIHPSSYTGTECVCTGVDGARWEAGISGLVGV